MFFSCISLLISVSEFCCGVWWGQDICWPHVSEYIYIYNSMYAEHALLIILYLEALQTNMISILCIIIGSSGCPHLNSRARIVGFFWDANLSQAAQAIKPWVAESISFFLPQMLIPLENRHFQWVFPSGWIPRFFIHADILRSSANQFLGPVCFSPSRPRRRRNSFRRRMTRSVPCTLGARGEQLWFF